MAGSRGLITIDRTLSSLSLLSSVLASFSRRWSPSGGRDAISSSRLNLLSAEERPLLK